MALRAKAMGVIVIAVTNIEYSQAVVSRHETGKKLLDIADIVIVYFCLLNRRQPISKQIILSAASDVYKKQRRGERRQRQMCISDKE